MAPDAIGHKHEPSARPGRSDCRQCLLENIMRMASGRIGWVRFTLVITVMPGVIATQGSSLREVQFTTADTVRVTADLHVGPGPRTGPMLLLFHQGGASARGEYGPIIPRLLSAGYHVLAVDQRSGGDRFDGVNRTMRDLRSRTSSYCDVYADLEAALRFVRREGFTGKIVAWGSSYSATLAIRLGADHGDEVAAVVAFSPAGGEPMAGCQPGPMLTRLKVPLLVLRPPAEMELAHVRELAESLARHGHQLFVPERGVHGSSMLVAERVGGPVEATWDHVLRFLSRSTQ
jgi:pimeloyl-ACP methyl ester carboxylesterase